MLRWVTVSATVCAASFALGFGKVVPLGGGLRDCFLAMAAIAAMVTVSSCDAYETQIQAGED